MNREEIEQLRQIKTLPSLIKYLRDELEWPISLEAVEDDITFTYSAEELGLESEYENIVKDIKQIRPLDSKQPWGIFWINFDKRKLPVVILRRILGHLSIERRARKKSAQQASWDKHDLLFISAYGEDNDRAVTLAHFSQNPDSPDDLPALKVLGWDDSDTVPHLADAHQTLKEKLRWPADPGNIDAWRKEWSAAFTLQHREVIDTTEKLVEELAKLAKSIYKRTNTAIKKETEKGPLRRLHKAFKESLIHDLDEKDFADIIAQTVSYGLLTARFSRDENITVKNLVEMVPPTNPFLRELLGTFLHLAGRRHLFDFDELGIQDVVNLLNHANIKAIKNDFGNRASGEDPVIHFYEHFLSAYNKEQKIQRGVFYTPQPVVSYIVRSVHELLQTEFDLKDGLASTVTWREMVKRNKHLKIPEGVDPDSAFVQILDPATGTATFLVEVIDVIHKTMMAKWQKEGVNEKQKLTAWNEYVSEHLLSRLHGYELMMAPYAIAHMKIGLKLVETGYQFTSDERVRIYLTNTLEPPHDFSDRFAFDVPALAHEAQAVNAIKRHQRFTVVIGNPPYSGLSANMSEFAAQLIEPYKLINGSHFGERKHWLHDDYVKFFSFAENTIKKSDVGIVGLITNHAFYDNPTFRGMRWNLLQTFTRISLLDLHGNTMRRERSTNGVHDMNVFDIQQGVAISILSKLSAKNDRFITHGELWGLREQKYSILTTQDSNKLSRTKLNPSAEFFFFVPRSDSNTTEYDSWIKLNDIFKVFSGGFITARDNFVIDFDRSELLSRIENFADRTMTDSGIRKQYFSGCGSAKYLDGDTRGWKLPTARARVRQDSDWRSRVYKCLYRPFDIRWIYWAEWMVDWPRPEVNGHLLNKGNIALIFMRQAISGDDYSHFIVSRLPVDNRACYSNKGIMTLAPLYVYESAEQRQGELFIDKGGRQANFTPAFLKKIKESLGGAAGNSQFSTEDILCYAYAVFHSPTYRSRYSEILKIDFPHLPVTSIVTLFITLAKLGSEIISLHLMESSKLDKHITKFNGDKNSEVEKVAWSDTTVWIDKEQTLGFMGVSEVIWNFQIGGYQVCEKWLKDRKGRKLSKDDIDHYQRIIVALSETIRLMAEIDKVIDAHGGWPKAFQQLS